MARFMPKNIFFFILASIISNCFIFIMTTNGYASEPIKIGLSLSLSGKYADIGQLQKDGYNLWEDDINKKGGILGRKVEVTIYDDASSTSNARILYKQLILKDKVDFLFGPYSSDITIAVADLADKYHYPMLIPGASSDTIWANGYHYVFGIWSPASNYLLGFLQPLKLHQVSDISVVYAKDNFSLGIAKGIKKWAAPLGFKILLFHEIKIQENNLDHIAALVKKKNAQSLFVIGHFQEAINMKEALAKINWNPKIFYATVAPTLPQYYNVLQKESENTFSSSNWEPDSGLKLPGAKKFNAAYRLRYNEAPSYHAATAYAAGELLESAIKMAHSIDKKEVRDILSTLNMTTLIGRYGVDKVTGIQTSHFPIVIQWQHGKKKIVWPKTLRTALPVF